ncbi:MAG: hypothetical protein H6R42_1042, partial [Nitrospirae bacterium]|nr:hypothetical protein [Nitrospirota bacterium]
MSLFLLFFSLFVTSCATQQVKPSAEKALPPEEAYYLFLSGTVAEKEGKWEDAIEYYNKALEKDPASSSLKLQISYLLLRTGRINEAIARTEEIIKQEPDYIPALLLLAQLHNSQKRSEDAIKIYRRILEIQPDHREASIFLSLLYA